MILLALFLIQEEPELLWKLDTAALDGATGKELWSYDATIRGHVYEGIDHAPLIADFDGDGTLDLFFVAGKGTSDETQSKNYGRAFALRAGKGKGSWETFRGNVRRTGTR